MTITYNTATSGVTIKLTMAETKQFLSQQAAIAVVREAIVKALPPLYIVS